MGIWVGLAWGTRGQAGSSLNSATERGIDRLVGVDGWIERSLDEWE